MFLERFAVGQNLYMSSSQNKKAEWNTVIQTWFDEYKIYKYPAGSAQKLVTTHK